VGSARRAFVTGASSGLGRALAAELLRRGWQVAAAARRGGELETLDKFAASPEQLRTFAVDVTDEPALRAAVDGAASRFGGLDVAVANAGIGVPGLAETLPLTELRRVFEVNVIGAAATLIAALPHLRGAPEPLLVGVSSLAAHRGGPGSGAYNASKAAFSRWLESLRMELAAEGVGVLEIVPGFVRTPMTDRNRFAMPFLMEPEDAARRMADAIERRRSHLAFPRRLAFAIGVLRRMPDGLFDRFASRLTARLRSRGQLGGDE
jgi:NAD(P)-dependent dehydrogenase (short-subunit alcohol dehydrogenase family)